MDSGNSEVSENSEYSEWEEGKSEGHTDEEFDEALVVGSKRKHDGEGMKGDLKKKIWACVFEGCGKSFNKRSKLDEHHRTHTGEVRKTLHLKQKIQSPQVFVDLFAFLD